jgi:DNA-binding CsgD family transcriptional regulator
VLWLLVIETGHATSPGSLARDSEPTIDPLFLESLKTQQPELRSDIMRRLPDQHEQAHLKKVKEFQLDYGIQAVMTDGDRGAIFSFILSSEAEGRRYLTPLSELVPFLFRALLNSYRYPLLTDRKKTILLWRAQGKRPNVIASELGITPRTVKMHWEEIVRKLYAEDLVHAVWIGGQIGMKREKDVPSAGIGCHRIDRLPEDVFNGASCSFARARTCPTLSWISRLGRAVLPLALPVPHAEVSRGTSLPASYAGAYHTVALDDLAKSHGGICRDGEEVAS